MRIFIYILFSNFFLITKSFSQGITANYIGNGGFEIGCPKYFPLPFWPGLDSSNCPIAGFFSNCVPNIPFNGFTYQFPKNGNSYAISTFYLPNSSPIGYLKNRLKKKLINGQEYCVKMYLNLSNSSTYGINGVGVSFGNEMLDTIKTCPNSPLSYLQPQIKTPVNLVIKDTLNWVLVTGTFIANGTEKYALIGNFLANSVVTKSVSNPTGLPVVWSDYCVDDVSCIPIDLPADAGPDKSCKIGDSVYIGRQRDVGIDEDCMWYKLPITITPTTPAIDTAAGIYVKPTQTSTYVVRQEICGVIKYDTVVVFSDLVGIDDAHLFFENLRLFPNPTENKITFSINTPNQIFKMRISNVLGQELVMREHFTLEEELDLGFLPKGIYYLKIENAIRQKVFKVFKE